MKLAQLLMEKRDGGYKFSAVLYELPADLSDRIITWGKKCIKPHDLYTGDPTMGREDQIHTTVKYGLHTVDTKKVQKAIKGFQDFEIELGKVGLFKAEKYDVVMIKVKGPKLHQLHKKISSGLDNTDKHPVYRPHVTIAYVKPGKADDIKDNCEFDGTKIKVSRLVFSAHDGKQEDLYLD